MDRVWLQNYEPLGHSTGHGLALSALLASLPILTLLFLLGVRRKPAWVAALAGLLVTFALAVGAYRMPVAMAVSSAAYGAAFGLFPISWIVFWAIFLYRLTVKTGQFEVIKESLASLTSDSRLQALLIAFSFGAFIEGAAGFGTPVAVAAAMLMGLGFSSFDASAVCLLANTAPVAFGSIGIPVITLAGITGLPLDKLSADVGRLCAPLSFIIPAYLIAVMTGMAGLREVWPAVLVCGGTFASVQFLISNYVGPQLTDILSSLSSLAGLLILLRFWRPAKGLQMTPTVEKGERIGSSAKQILYAWSPYAFLVVCVLLWGYKPMGALLGSASVSFPWPLIHQQILRTPPVVAVAAKYPALYTLNWLSASGTSCMAATLLSAVCFRVGPREFGTLILDVARQLALPTLTVSAVLAMAFLMNYSGATGTLGLAFGATGILFPFFSSLLGWVGVFLTGSDTSANALFGTVQVVTARHLGFDPSLIAASNSAGGVMGKMISLQTIAVAAAATTMPVADQARLFRLTLRHSIILASAVGIEVSLYAFFRV